MYIILWLSFLHVYSSMIPSSLVPWLSLVTRLFHIIMTVKLKLELKPTHIYFSMLFKDHSIINYVQGGRACT